MDPTRNSEVYRYPRYYAIGYRWNTEAECRFIEGCLATYGPSAPRLGPRPWPEGPRSGSSRASEASRGTTGKRLLDIGCGAGRHMLVLAQRGYKMTGLDLSPEMVAFANDASRAVRLEMTVATGDLRRLQISGTFDAAFCFMDTFRFLLTNEEILAHLRAVADRLVPGGLYLTDFWVPRQWDQIGNEIHQWEQAEAGTAVRVFYLQHPDSVDPVSQTFEDELIFEVRENGQTTEIRGGRTRTRLMMPQEFRAVVDASGAFDVAGTFGDFDLTKPFDQATLSWRMISVLKKRAGHAQSR